MTGEVLLIEDDYRNRDADAENLERVLGRKVHAIEAPQFDEIPSIIERKPALIIVDYELTMKRHDDAVVKYQGGTLLYRLREESPEIPLAMVTRPSIYNGFPQIRSLDDVADFIFLKSYVEEHEKEISKKLNAIIDGYQKISDYKIENRDWDLLLKLLGGNEKEGQLLDETNPPMGPDNSLREDGLDIFSEDDPRTNKGWTAHEASRWITGTLFAFPGILYNEKYAATSLGIEPEEFSTNEEIHTLFKNAEYKGIFKEYGNFWWRGRLRNIAINLAGKLGIKQIHEIFVPWLKDEKNIDVEASKCRYSDEEYADTICYILNKPVKTKYSFIYYPDNRPSIMDPARVSFKAVKESNKVKLRLLKKSDLSIFHSLRGE